MKLIIIQIENFAESTIKKRNQKILKFEKYSLSYTDYH